MRYCGFLSLPRAVLRYSSPPYAPSFYEKIFWIEVWRNFLQTLLIVTLVTEGLLSISFAALLLIKVHFFEDQVIGLDVLQKDHDLFLPFLHTMSATDDTWNMSALLCCLFVWMFFFYLLSSYKRAWGSIKLVWDWKWFGTTRQSQAKKQTISLRKIWGQASAHLVTQPEFKNAKTSSDTQSDIGKPSDRHITFHVMCLSIFVVVLNRLL